jgi:hypothetical protein
MALRSPQLVEDGPEQVRESGMALRSPQLVEGNPNEFRSPMQKREDEPMKSGIPPLPLEVVCFT